MLNASREYENNMSRSELDDGSDREFSSDSVVFDEGQVPNATLPEGSTSSVMRRAGGTAEDSKSVPHRKPITEVLHDIYDKKVH